MKKIIIFGLVIILLGLGCHALAAENPDAAFKAFFRGFQRGLLFNVRPSGNAFYPVDYLAVVPDSIHSIAFRELPLRLQDTLNDIAAEPVFSFLAKNLWSGRVETYFAGIERGRQDGGITVFNEKYRYALYIKVNPNLSEYSRSYVVTLPADPATPLEILGYRLTVERDDNRETTNVTGYLIVRSKTEQTVAAFGGKVDCYSKLGTRLTSDSLRFEIQDEIDLTPGQPTMVKLNLRFPPETRMLGIKLNKVLLDNGEKWENSSIP